MIQPNKDVSLMYPLGEEKMTFMIDRSFFFCYKVMPFGPKNVGATYQC